MRSLMLIKIGAALLCLIGLGALVAYDARQHFDSELVQLKKKHHSGQRNWSLFFGQENVYDSAGLRHFADFSALESLYEPNVGVLSDIATSYYFSAHLPAYAKNVHAHQGRQYSPEWGVLLDSKTACYLDVEEHLNKFNALIANEEARAKARNRPPVRYVAVNREANNINFKRDCLSQRRGAFLSVVDKIATLAYEGETLLLYRLTTAPAQGNQNGSK